MIRYYCDKCNKELKQNDIYTVTIMQEKFVFHKYQLCEECENIIQDIYEEKYEKKTDELVNKIKKQQKEIEDLKIEAMAYREMLSDIKKGIEIEF